MVCRAECIPLRGSPKEGTWCTCLESIHLPLKIDPNIQELKGNLVITQYQILILLLFLKDLLLFEMQLEGETEIFSFLVHPLTW